MTTISSTEVSLRNKLMIQSVISLFLTVWAYNALLSIELHRMAFLNSFTVVIMAITPLAIATGLAINSFRQSMPLIRLFHFFILVANLIVIIIYVRIALQI